MTNELALNLTEPFLHLSILYGVICWLAFHFSSYTSPNQVIVADRFPITNDIKLVDLTRTTADNRYCSRYQHCRSENLHDQRLYLRWYPDGKVNSGLYDYKGKLYTIIIGARKDSVIFWSSGFWRTEFINLVASTERRCHRNCSWHNWYYQRSSKISYIFSVLIWM